MKMTGDSMKVIFLDVDGVLNWFDDCDAKFKEIYTGIDPGKVLLLKEIVDRTGASIVLSSDWRRFEEFADHVSFRLEEAGLDNFIDYTPIDKNEALATLGWPNKMSMYYKRAVDILAWLWDNPDVGNYVVLDDMEIIGDYERGKDGVDELADRFVKTNPLVGLTQENVERAVEILGEIGEEV